jgi:folate-dependent tRNA-U54 methylase TrmFO/GidA
MADFQPMKSNFGILPALELTGRKLGKRERGQAYATRAMADLESYLSAHKQYTRAGSSSASHLFQDL